MTQLAKTRTNEIITLHGEIEAGAMTMLDNAIRIGELLTEQKASLKHGEWIPWVEGNLPFNRRQASNYIRVSESQGELNGKRVSHLPMRQLVDILSESKATPETWLCHHCGEEHPVGDNPCHEAATEAAAGILSGTEIEQDDVVVEDKEDEIDEPKPRININDLADDVRDLTRKAELLAIKFMGTRITVSAQSKQSRKYVGKSYDRKPGLDLISEIRKMEKVLLIGD